MSKKILIVDGCSREELFDALRLVKEARSVRFILKYKQPPEKKISAQISMIRSKDTLGELWEIELFFQWDDVKRIGFKGILPDTVQAEYSTKEKKGEILIP